MSICRSYTAKLIAEAITQIQNLPGADSIVQRLRRGDINAIPDAYKLIRANGK